MSDIIGKPLDRVDGRLKVTGKAQYAAEFPLDDLVYGVLIQSAIAKGNITQIDTRAAEKVPGVLSIITHLNAPKLQEVPAFLGTPTSKGVAAQNFTPLRDNVVHYSGQHLGIVIADTLERATHAASLIKINYREEKPITDMQADTLRAFAPSTVRGRPADMTRGNPTQRIAEAPVRVEQTYTTPVEHHNPIEPHSAIAVWKGEHLTIYDSTQWILGVQQGVATALGIPQENVRVISHFVGGAFGCKLFYLPHVTLAALASKQVNCPVKLVLTREQMYASTGYRPQTQQRVALGATQEGRLTSILHEAMVQTSPFDEFVAEHTTAATSMLYACPNVKTSYRMIRINAGTPITMRAPGEATGLFALESGLDELAYALQLDPIELRLRNFAEIDPEKNLPWSSNSLKECYRQGAEHFGWERRNPKPGSMRNGRYLVGWGMANATYPMTFSPATATARLFVDGRLVVQSATHEIGTGTYTVMSQIAAEVLDLPMQAVRFELGETNFPTAPRSSGSRGAASVGSAVQAAAIALRRKIIQMAVSDQESPLHRASLQDVFVKNGRLILKNSNQGEAYTDVLKRQGLKFVEASGEVKPKDTAKQFSMHSFGTQFAEVHVDPDLGIVRVTRFVGAYGAGRILNLKTARSQMIGAIVGGIGMALMEQTHMDTNFGRYTNANLAEYLVPVHADVPNIDILFVEEDDPHVNPLGAKGIGEIGIVGVAPAIANAVYHATGKRIRNLPMTPDKLL